MSSLSIFRIFYYSFFVYYEKAGYLLELSKILAEERDSFDVNVRVAAGLAAKNCLVARDIYRRQQLIDTFKSVDRNIKSEIKRLVNG
jgi:hypothetical protein